VVASAHATPQEVGGGGGGLGLACVALVAHTGCYLEVAAEGGGRGPATLVAAVQRQTEYAPRPPSAAQTFVLAPLLPLASRSSSSSGGTGRALEVCVRSLDGLWLLAAACGSEPRPEAALWPAAGGAVPPACRWEVGAPAVGLAPLRCGFLLPLRNRQDDAAVEGSGGGSTSELAWFGCGPQEAYLDRKAGARVGRWRGPVDQQTFR
jgi:hypothetical protein